MEKACEVERRWLAVTLHVLVLLPEETPDDHLPSHEGELFPDRELVVEMALNDLLEHGNATLQLVIGERPTHEVAEVLPLFAAQEADAQVEDLPRFGADNTPCRLAAAIFRRGDGPDT